MEPLRERQGDIWDRRQESRLNIGEPVRVLHRGNGWLYIVSEATEGYVREDGVSFCTKKQYEDYGFSMHQACRVVVKAGRNSTGRYFRVGTVLPASITEGDAPAEQGPVFAFRFLPYTERQMRLQMERMLGISYSWGDERVDGMDCSSTVRGFYACFGLSLPRNSEEQRGCGEILSAMHQACYAELAGKPVDRKKEIIAGMGIGTVLHMPGHVMLYAGEKEGEPQIFHNCDTYLENGKEHIVRKTVISRFFPKGEGTYLDYVTAAWKPFL